jgi:hypothetical protein
MECSLWSALPTELLERVLTFLPFPFLFRLRSVCKRWNALPHCSYFRQLVGNRPWGACLPVLFCKDASADEDEGWNSDSWSAFDTTSQQWRRLPPLTCLDVHHRKYLVVGSGGLLCIGDFESTHNNLVVLVVCNPVTRAFRELPPTSTEWAEPDLTAMAIAGPGYKLILAGNRAFNPDSDPEYRTTEVFDSLSQAWAIAGDIPPNLELHSQEGALCKNKLYCLARDLKQGTWNTLVAYDLTTSKWTVISHDIPHGSRTPHVMGSHERILAMSEHDEGAILYELDIASRKWREVSKVPVEMYGVIGKRVVACTVDGEYLCVTGCSANQWYSLMYSHGKWVQVPTFPIESSKGSELLLSSSPFRPSLQPV